MVDGIKRTPHLRLKLRLLPSTCEECDAVVVRLVVR